MDGGVGVWGGCRGKGGEGGGDRGRGVRVQAGVWEWHVVDGRFAVERDVDPGGLGGLKVSITLILGDDWTETAGLTRIWCIYRGMMNRGLGAIHNPNPDPETINMTVDDVRSHK